MFVGMIGMYHVQVTIVEVIHVIVVPYLLMSARRAMLMVVTAVDHLVAEGRRGHRGRQQDHSNETHLFPL